MPMIDRTDGELDPAVVFAEDDRIRAEAAAETSKSSELQHATTRCDALIYRRQENARPDSSGYAAVSPIFNGDDGAGGDACEVSEFDAYTMLLLEGLGDALGMIRTEHRREWKAADAELLDRQGLQRAWRVSLRPDHELPECQSADHRTRAPGHDLGRNAYRKPRERTPNCWSKRCPAKLRGSRALEGKVKSARRWPSRANRRPAISIPDSPTWKR